MVILSSHHPRVPRTPLQDGRPCLQNGACAARVIRSFCLSLAPRCLPTLNVHPSRSSASLPPENGGIALVFSSFPIHPVRRFFSLRRLARPSSSSTTTSRPFALHHSDLPFLSLDHSDLSRNKCYPHLPRFPLFPRVLRP